MTNPSESETVDGLSERTSAALTEKEREQVQMNLATLEEIGDAVGGWESGHVQARRKSFTMTIRLDNEVDPFLAERFARLMAQAPALMPPYLRRLFEFDAALTAAATLRPPREAEGRYREALEQIVNAYERGVSLDAYPLARQALQEQPHDPA